MTAPQDESAEPSNSNTLESTAAETAKWDLTSSISPYLDLHMMFPLLEYVDRLIADGFISYSHQDVASSRLALLRPTHMVDYAMDIYRELHSTGKEDETVEAPQEMEEQKAKVFEKLEELREGCKDFDELCRDETLRNKLVRAGQWTVAGLTSTAKSNVIAEGESSDSSILRNANIIITKDQIETYRNLAKFNYDCGDYQSAKGMLECYLSLFASPPLPATGDEGEMNADMSADPSAGNESKTDQNSAVPGSSNANPAMYHLREINADLLQVLWGLFSCEILLEQWEGANTALTAVKTAIESLSASSADAKNRMTALEALQQRTWLLHWSLFVFWNDTSTSKPQGYEQMMELFLSERYLQAITTNAPHLLRYLTAAVLLSKRKGVIGSSKSQQDSTSRTRVMKDLVRVMGHCEYSDPIVEFVDCLSVKFSFEQAQITLKQCESVLQTDFFLSPQTARFMEEARVFIFENYCRIHHKIDLDSLSVKLAMDPSDAERWIVDLIRNAYLDAKIDSEARCVVMGSSSKTVYEQVMEKTKDLNLRTNSLVSNLGTLLSDAKKEKKRRERAALEDEDDEY